MRVAAASLILLLAVIGGQAAPPRMPDWYVSLEERILADDNILRLSEFDKTRLENDPSFQTDVEGVAALRAEHRMGAGLRWRLRGKSGPTAMLQRWAGGKPGAGRLDLNAEARWTHVEGSSAAGFSVRRLALGWQPRPGWGAEFSWRQTGNYYLRQFNDRDTGQERGATFNAEAMQLQLRARGRDLGAWVRQPGLTLNLGSETTYYNAWFTEYDTEAWSLGMNLDWKLPKGFNSGLGYEYSSTDNVGWTGTSRPGVVNLGVDSEGGDGSHQEDQGSLSLGWSGRWDKRLISLDGSLTLRDRWYQSNLGALQDPFHYGRHDRRWQLALRGRVDLGATFALFPIVERDWRLSGAAWNEISRTKNYTVWRAGLGLRWRWDS